AVSLSCPVWPTSSYGHTGPGSAQAGAGDVALAAAQHQPPAVQVIGRFGAPRLVADPLVVDRGAALAHGAPGRSPALTQSRTDQQVDDRGPAGRVDLRDLGLGERGGQ